MKGMDGVENIKEFETALCMAYKEVCNIKEYLEENVSEEVLSKMNDLERGVPCYFEKMGGNSYGSESDIVLNRISSLPHEAIHTMMATGVDGERVWLDEGLAEYFGSIMFNRFMAVKLADSLIQ